jgi:anti-anti-sigma regulatory factor
VECRIEVVREDAQSIVRLAGRLAEAQTAAFLEACADAGRAPLLDLTDLISVDAVGLDALMRLQAQGARLAGLPEYIRLKLELLTRERGAQTET